MIIELGGLLLGLALLVLGAEGLVRGSVSVAVGLGMTPLVAGLTVAAYGTSSPELVVSVRAALAGSGEIAAGNAIGSNIANIALILGITALIRPLKVDVQMIRIDIPLMILATLLLIVLLWDGFLGRFGGGLLFTLLIAYTAWSVYYARKTASRSTVSDPPPRPKFVHYFFIVGGLAALVTGATLFVNGATSIAREVGISEAVIGLTLVAVGTSLPEMATSILAGVRGQADVAVGNIVGSCIFNILGILGLTALIAPISADGIGVRDFAVLTAATLVVLPLSRSGFTLVRWEGALLIAGYVGYVVWLLLG